MCVLMCILMCVARVWHGQGALEEAEERNEQAKSLLGDAARRLEDTERLMHVSQQEALASLREELETMTVRAERMV